MASSSPRLRLAHLRLFVRQSPSGMRVGIFGGSFNPPHVGHQMLGLYVLETAAIDELWFVPAFRHALGKPLEPFGHRLKMCERAVAALGARARVSDVEGVIGGD